MTNSMWMALALAGAALAPAGTVIADDGSDVDALRHEVAVLRGELAEMRRAAGDQWLTERRAEAIRGLVHEVLADADTRASLQSDGLTAGWNGKFFLASADGNFLLQLEGQVQTRFALNMRDDSSEDDTQWGFEARRTKLKFGGHVVNPDWTYKIVIAMARDDDTVVLEDAWIQKSLCEGWSARVGRFKGPFLREELVSSAKQLLVDRSAVNERYNQDRSEGIQLTWTGDRIRAAGMYGDGWRSTGTRFNQQMNEFAVMGRGEFLADGTWKQFDDLTSWSGDDFGLLVGAAAYYEKGAYGTPAGPEEETFGWTADVSIEFGGANLLAYVVGRDMDVAGTDELAFVVQGGIFVVPDEVELFARYEWGDTDLPGDEDLSLFTVGVNRYWAKHGLKWTTDLGFGLDEVTGSWDSSGIALEDDAAGEDGQIFVRTQLQLLF